VSCRFYSPWKIHGPRPGLKSQILGLLASTLFTTPPRTTLGSLQVTRFLVRVRKVLQNVVQQLGARKQPAGLVSINVIRFQP
jgi:hypothetical protein